MKYVHRTKDKKWWVAMKIRLKLDPRNAAYMKRELLKKCWVYEWVKERFIEWVNQRVTEWMSGLNLYKVKQIETLKIQHSCKVIHGEEF